MAAICVYIDGGVIKEDTGTYEPNCEYAILDGLAVSELHPPSGSESTVGLGLPELDQAQVNELIGAIAVLWVIAWVGKQLRRAADRME